MVGARRSLRVAVAASSFALLTVAGRARAEVSVSLHYETKAELEHARRVASELSSEGYVVEVSELSELTPCDPNGPRLVTTPRGTKAWIRLAPDPADPEQIVAFICYLGAQPLLQQAAPSAPRAEAEALAVAAAEALNGLRAKLPPLQSEPERAPRREVEPPAPRVEQPQREAPQRHAGNSVVLGAALLQSLPDFPATPGIAARAALGIVPSLSFVIDAFAPLRGGELASDTMTAEVRTSWIRVGPELGWSLGDFRIAMAALAGPALTWATAVASPPREGTADVAHGAIVSLAASLQYPATTPIFGCASLSGSAILPGARINLGESTSAPRGYFPIDASIGFGVRWGENASN